MIPSRIFPILILMAFILGTAGCTQLFPADTRASTPSNTTAPASIATYKHTLAQPEDSAKLIKMDTDVFNIGEVVEFVITNEKTSDISCKNNPPTFSVRYQTSTGRWVTRMGEENTAPVNTTFLKPGESTAPSRFVTTGWAPGRYRIVSDCGISREILIREIPSAAPAVTPCPLSTNSSPYIRINPVGDQYAGERFTIAGTTNLAAGEDLRYSIFALLPLAGNVTSAKLASGTLQAGAGSCGISTWSVDGLIQVPGEYFIGISNSANTVSAVRRFTILDAVRPTTTATLPEKTSIPGITTG